jgi:hypothetical protein
VAREIHSLERRQGPRRAKNDRRAGSDRRSADRRKPSERLDVTRLEHNDLRERVEFLTKRLTRIETEYQVQFTRIAQIQAELDALARKTRSA